MKRHIVITMMALAAISVQAMAQVDLRKKIEVTGEAVRILRPDEIYLRITLKEYKNGSRIVGMDKLEAELVRALRKLDIDGEKLTVENIYGYNWDWRKKRTDDFLASKSFRLEVSDLKKINDLVEYLDPEGLSQLQVAEVRHSREDEIREELAREALQKARSKAEGLLNSIDEELGGVLEIRSTGNGANPPGPVMYRMAEADTYNSQVEYRNIELQVHITAVFEIK